MEGLTSKPTTTQPPQQIPHFLSPPRLSFSPMFSSLTSVSLRRISAVYDRPLSIRRAVGSEKRLGLLGRLVSFCSDSSDGGGGGGEVVAEAVKSEEAAEAKSSSSTAILHVAFRPEDCLTVVALPLPHRPLFPGFYMPIYVKDPKLLAALVESRKRHAPYAGAFLLKEAPEGSALILDQMQYKSSKEMSYMTAFMKSAHWPRSQVYREIK